MEIKEGYLYHIKDEFFEVVKDDGLMGNHENGGTRPTYFVVKENQLLWFVPLSTKVGKYEKIIEEKIKKHGSCITILIGKVFSEKSAILIQNAFPTLPKYVDHYHVKNGIITEVPVKIQRQVVDNLHKMLEYKKKGVNLFYSNVDKIKETMLNEYYVDKLSEDIHIFTFKIDSENETLYIKIPSYFTYKEFLRLLEDKFNIIKVRSTEVKRMIDFDLTKEFTIRIDNGVLKVNFIEENTYPLVEVFEKAEMH